MKFAILSDIHGNIYALKKCFEYIEKLNIDGIIWCGDYITDIPRPNEVLDFIKETMKKYTTYIIKGNREDKVLKCENNAERVLIKDENMLSTYQKLTEENLNFIKNMPDTCTINLNGRAYIYVSHKKDYNNGKDCIYKIFGHTHKQFIFYRDGVEYINPGSIGLPTSGKAGINFAILTIEEDYNNIEQIFIKYDNNEAIKELENDEISEIGIKWGLSLTKALKTGIDYPILYIQEARKLASKYGFGELDNKIPMKLWEEARKKLKIF